MHPPNLLFFLLSTRDSRCIEVKLLVGCNQVMSVVHPIGGLGISLGDDGWSTRYIIIEHDIMLANERPAAKMYYELICICVSIYVCVHIGMRCTNIETIRKRVCIRYILAFIFHVSVSYIQNLPCNIYIYI